MNDPVSQLLDRLEGVRGREGNWIARCPAHEERSPSLSIGIGDDGRVLLHCHAGCGPADVVGAVGLEMSNLFTGDLLRRRYDQRPKVDWKGMVFHLRHEFFVLEIAAGKVSKGKKLNDDELATMKRVRKSFARLNDVR